MNTRKIIARASQLKASMPGGEAYFQAAREAGTPAEEVPAQAEIAATVALNDEINSPAMWAAAQYLNDHDVEHEQARALVGAWAKAMGRTGGHFKQTRQSRIRKIVKNGLNSPYADRMRAEAGL